MSCSTQKTITQNKVTYITIPNELLELEELKKPIVKTESDIIKAYLDLFNAYKVCEYNIITIKKLNKAND